MDPAREEILGRLRPEKSFRKETRGSVAPEDIYFPLKNNLAEIFKTNLELLNGQVFIFPNEKGLYAALQEQIKSRGWQQICCRETLFQEKLKKYGIPFNSVEIPGNTDAGITGCEYLVAHLGSAVVSSAQGSGRQLFVYPPAHIILAGENQVVGYLEEAYQKIIGKYGAKLPSLVSTITGPSRTADIEKTLVLGAHGPKELFVYILKTNPE